MILTKNYLKKFQESMRISLPDNVEKKLLKEYGQPVVDDEGYIYVYTEQDIYEQIRKAVQGSKVG